MQMTVQNNNDNNTVNVLHSQRTFCMELFLNDNTTQMFKWDEANAKDKSDPVLSVDQPPKDQKQLTDWISGTTAAMEP